MSDEGGFWVTVLSDSVNTFPGVMYALRRVCDLDIADALDATRSIQRNGSARLVRCADRAGADARSAELAALGLRTTVQAV